MRSRAVLQTLVAAGSLALMFGSSWVDHARLARDPHLFNDDARHWLVPSLREEQPGLRADDYLVNYRQAMTPPGQMLAYRVGARTTGVTAFSKALPLVQYALLLATLAWCAVRLGGWVCAWATVALGLSSYVFLYQMAGGTARSWAFPLAGLAAAALIGGWIPALAALTVLAAFLYPPSVVVLGLAFAFALPAAPMRPSRKWPLALLTALACAALLIPGLRQEYGRRLGPADVGTYPELGSGGRYGNDDRPPYLDVASAVADNFGRSLQGGDPPWIPALRARIMAGSVYGRPSIVLVGISAVFGLVVVWGTFRLGRRSAETRRLLLLLAASCLAYEAARFAAPALYFPQRHLIHTLPILTVLLLPAAILELARNTRGLRAPACVVAGTVMVLALLGGRGAGANGLTVDARDDRTLYRKIAGLPADSLLAGWPQGILDNIPWLCRRSVLLNWECHESIHQGYADEMRRRMSAVTAAYFATSAEPLERLRSDWGVTHLLVDLAHYDAEPPDYFVPFRDEVRTAHAAMRERGSEVVRRLARGTLDQDGTRVLLDLGRLLETRTEPSPATL
jgi:hypothetical protein